MFAVKEIPLASRSERFGGDKGALSFSQMEAIAREIETLAQMDDSNVVAYFGTLQMGRSLYIQMELVEGGSMDKFIQYFGPQKDDMASLWHCFKTVCKWEQIKPVPVTSHLRLQNK